MKKQFCSRRESGIVLKSVLSQKRLREDSVKENTFHFIKNYKLDGVKCLIATVNNFSYIKHTHDEYALGVIISGTMKFNCKGTLNIGNKGDVISINPQEVHDGFSDENKIVKYIMLYIRPDLINKYFSQLGYRGECYLEMSKCLVNNNELKSSIIKIYNAIINNHSLSSNYEDLLLKLASSIMSINSKKINGQNKEGIILSLTKSKEFIQNNLDSELMIDDISSLINMSKYHFIRCFNESFGITPHQYVINCRINKAIKNLESGINCKTSANNAGFSDASHFNRRFKLVYGLTPRQYQVQLLKNRII